MITPALALAFAALVPSSSAVAATLMASKTDSRGWVIPPASSRVHRAAAAGVPSEERKLQLGQICFVFETNESYDYILVSCDEVSCFLPVCEADEESSYKDGAKNCAKIGAFEVTNPNEPGCPWRYACCKLSLCFEIKEGGHTARIPCDAVVCSGPACAADEGTSYRDGSTDCAKTGAFELTNPNLASCAWQHSCCTVVQDDAIR
jgi:hypothetical protein